MQLLVVSTGKTMGKSAVQWLVKLAPDRAGPPVALLVGAEFNFCFEKFWTIFWTIVQGKGGHRQAATWKKLFSTPTTGWPCRCRTNGVPPPPTHTHTHAEFAAAWQVEWVDRRKASWGHGAATLQLE